MFCDTIVDYDIEQLKKLELKEKYTKIKNGEYDAHEDDETEWDVTDLSLPCSGCTEVDDVNKPPFNLGALSISFSGCGFLGIYHMGVVAALRQYLPDLRVIKVAGCSAGALAAVSLLLDTPLDVVVHDILDVSNKARRLFLGPFNPNFDICANMIESLEQILPEDAHRRVSKALHISITDVYTGQNKVISSYATRAELIDAIIASTFIPAFSGIYPARWRNTPVIDGGFSVNQVRLDDATLTVSPFSGEAIISPTDKNDANDARKLLRMWIAQMGANVSWANIKRLSNVLFPPSSKILADLLMGGYLDATNFLATYGFVKNCPMCLTVKTVIKKSPLKMYEDKDFHFPEVLVQAAKMLLENTGWQRAKQLEEEMRKSSVVHMAISTAKTILYYTPVIFLTRWTVVYLAKIFVRQLFNLATSLAETTDFQIMVEQILGLLIGVFGPLLGIPKEWVTADDRTLIHFNEKTTQKVQRRRAKFYCEVHVVKAKEEGHISEALLNKKRCRCAKIKKILDEKARDSGDDQGVDEHDHHHFEEDHNTDENGMTELLSMQVEAYMDSDDVHEPTNKEEACRMQLNNLDTAAHSRLASIVPSVSTSLATSRITSLAASRRGSAQTSRRNSFSMETQTPETLENILRVTRTQESVLNAYYTDTNGEVVTMTLYDISETDPTDILGDDVLGGEAGAARRDSSSSTSEVKRYNFRSNSESRGGQIDPEHIQKKLQNLTNYYADDSDDVTSEENNISDNDVSIEEEEEEDINAKSTDRKPTSNPVVTL